MKGLLGRPFGTHCSTPRPPSWLPTGGHGVSTEKLRKNAGAVCGHAPCTVEVRGQTPWTSVQVGSRLVNGHAVRPPLGAYPPAAATLDSVLWKHGNLNSPGWVRCNRRKVSRILRKYVK